MACETFISCEDIGLSGDVQGIFNITLAIFTTDDDISGTADIIVDINGNSYKGFIISHEVSRVPNVPKNALSCNKYYYQHNITLQTVSV